MADGCGTIKKLKRHSFSGRTGLFQKDVALLLGVSTETVVHWELGQTDPYFDILPRFMDFLGYCPCEPAPSLSARLKAIRQKLLGISQEAMARAIGIDPTTPSRIERADGRVSSAVARKIERYRETLRRIQTDCSCKLSRSSSRRMRTDSGASTPNSTHSPTTSPGASTGLWSVKD